MHQPSSKVKWAYSEIRVFSALSFVIPFFIPKKKKVLAHFSKDNKQAVGTMWVLSKSSQGFPRSFRSMILMGRF